MNERVKQIYVRVTSREKLRIQNNAKRCGLSVSEYIRQRSLGFAPKAIPPGTYFELCTKLDEAVSLPGGEEIPAVLKEIREAVLLPERDL